MQWSKVFQLLYLSYYLIRNPHRSTKAVRAVHDSMPNSFEIGQTMDLLVVCAALDPIQEQFSRVAVISNFTLFFVARLLAV
jgi:hypothetical protein